MYLSLYCCIMVRCSVVFNVPIKGLTQKNFILLILAWTMMTLISKHWQNSCMIFAPSPSQVCPPISFFIGLLRSIRLLFGSCFPSVCLWRLWAVNKLTPPIASWLWKNSQAFFTAFCCQSVYCVWVSLFFYQHLASVLFLCNSYHDAVVVSATTVVFCLQPD